ncbi:MSHA biogenesis protein MshP [Vibrio tapetis]|uniref:Putative MSHA biogenesis protein MshP n=1 Tax=Vibrio tapetis subsp. tapetis TaxID=1671868 RepID=A0A2N8ZFN5_9VIBR|nr:MSHA biogenesis protein MshP [Vibrio tapetis]SON50675.1 putative MSHA biogenesis protein MshP [Vibrio tapetis subsp. tapetis]
MSRKRNQSGSVLIIAVFVIVVMGMLGLTLTRLEWSNQDTLTREVIGTQAWFVANSGSEWGLTHLFPLNEVSSAISASCTNLESKSSGATSTILANTENRCTSLVIRCTQVGSGADLTFYKVVSKAVCGTNDFEVQREQEVWARGLE